MSTKNLDLIVLSDNFGTSFSGGCTATANFVYHWKNKFKNIHVVCKQSDGFLHDDVQLWRYLDSKELTKILQQLAGEKTIGYGDYHTAYNFIDLNIPFYFTYHDNYPEQKALEGYTTQSTRMMDHYEQIFRNANYVFSVSENKLDFIDNYTTKYAVVRNGISQPITKREKLELLPDEPMRILMAGNIIERKYKYAADLFSSIEKEGIKKIQVDIFGINQDSELTTQLSAFDFVHLYPFKDVIDYNGYHMYLNTSSMENLSLSVVDAIRNHTPVVAFDVGGLREVVNGDNGILVKPYHIDKMKSALHEIRNSLSLFQFDVKKLADFDWKRSASRMLDIMNVI